MFKSDWAWSLPVHFSDSWPQVRYVEVYEGVGAKGRLDKETLADELSLVVLDGPAIKQALVPVSNHHPLGCNKSSEPIPFDLVFRNVALPNAINPPLTPWLLHKPDHATESLQILWEVLFREHAAAGRNPLETGEFSS